MVEMLPTSLPLMLPIQFGVKVFVVVLLLKILKSQLSAEKIRMPMRPHAIVHSWSSRVRFLLLATACLALADLLMARVNYNNQLSRHITPAKRQLLDFSEKHGCATARLDGTSTRAWWETTWLAEGKCWEFCDKTKSLAKNRNVVLEFVRSQHPVGKLGAVIFDMIRGVRQGDHKIDGLFQGRTCHRILQGVDKSNAGINVLCWAATAVAGVAYLICIEAFLRDALSSVPQCLAAETQCLGAALCFEDDTPSNQPPQCFAAEAQCLGAALRFEDATLNNQSLPSEEPPCTVLADGFHVAAANREASRRLAINDRVRVLSGTHEGMIGMITSMTHITARLELQSGKRTGSIRLENLFKLG